MILPTLVDMLVRKIQTGEINPVTGQAFTVEDIKLIEYKTEVERILASEQETPVEPIVSQVYFYV